MNNQPTPFQSEFPNIERVLDYWTFEAAPEIYTVAECIRALAIVLCASESLHSRPPIETLRGLLDAAEAAAKAAGPFIDEVTASHDE